MITLASFQNLFFLVDYHFNRDYYEALCVNKDKPEMHCNGKCELRKEASQSNSEQKTLKTGFDFTITIQEIETYIFEKPLFLKEKASVFSRWNATLHAGFLSLKPHPPQSFI